MEFAKFNVANGTWSSKYLTGIQILSVIQFGNIYHQLCEMHTLEKVKVLIFICSGGGHGGVIHKDIYTNMPEMIIEKLPWDKKKRAIRCLYLPRRKG